MLCRLSFRSFNIKPLRGNGSIPFDKLKRQVDVSRLTNKIKLPEGNKSGYLSKSFNIKLLEKHMRPVKVSRSEQT